MAASPITWVAHGSVTVTIVTCGCQEPWPGTAPVPGPCRPRSEPSVAIRMCLYIWPPSTRMLTLLMKIERATKPHSASRLVAQP